MRKSMWIAATLMLAAAGAAQAANLCGEIQNAYGPFDYRKRASLPFEIHMVEHAHFTQEVEQNVKGATSQIAGDIDYTLRAWPNHPRALAAMSRQGLIEKTPQPRGAHFPTDCYFLRAFQFAPDDGMPHAVYASHLAAHGKNDEAMLEFKRAVELDPENPTINYNAGLAYLKTKDYDKALLHAQKAYALKFPLPGLKNKLVEAGKWVEPPPAPEKPADGADAKPAADKPAEAAPADAAQPAK